MRPYKNQYIYPPRPEHKIRPTALIKYDDNTYFGQPKLNGSNCTLYIHEDGFTQRNRHEGEITNFKMNNEEICSLHRGKQKIVLVGEYMNKSKKDINGKLFNKKFVIFDILVYNNQYLVGQTTDQRNDLLESIFDLKKYDDFLYQITENVFMVKSFKKNFKKKYSEIVTVEMLEGLVLKRRNAKLERGTREKNNVGWNIKCRKETKNYQF